MERRMSVILRKCKSLSLPKLRRSTSITGLQSKSTTRDDAATAEVAVVFVGSSRRRYMISEKLLNHPLMGTLIEHNAPANDNDEKISVKCEVVLFDHLLWMLENADPGVDDEGSSLDELAQLYAY